MAFQRKCSNGRAPVDESGTEDGVRPEWRIAERVFAVRDTARGGRQYLTKWSMLGYAESTWEMPAALSSPEVCVHLLLQPRLVLVFTCCDCMLMFSTCSVLLQANLPGFRAFPWCFMALLRHL